MLKKAAIILIVLLGVQNLYAAVGCTLNDPDRDIKRLFPEATNYKTEFISIKEQGGKELAKEIEAKLSDKLDAVYESLDVPYAYYTVLKKKETMGYVHGVNQKGEYGGMQLILATDTNGVIIDFYFQKISSPESKKFKDKEFTKQFIGLSLDKLYSTDLKKKIEDPSENSSDDYSAILRGIKKNLVLHDEFKLGNRYDKYFYVDEKESEVKDENEKNN